MKKQRTLQRTMTYEGIGLHSGAPVVMTLAPAPCGSGIRFFRSDLGDETVLAHGRFVTNTLRATTLENGEVKVATVEHVLSALSALGIDNCLIGLSSPEPPVGDGSAAVFVNLIEQAGIVEQEANADIYCLPTPCAMYDEEGDRFVLAVPYDGFRVTFISENDHPLIGTMTWDGEITTERFKNEIMRARTIGFTHELEALRQMGLAKGGTLENAVVYSPTECLSALRYEDELVRHKVLDLVGDLFLAGRIHAHVIARKSGHALNTALAQKILALKEESVC